MVARIVAVANQKGGSGKTTIAVQLGGTLARGALKIAIVDADPQGSATRWVASAPDDEPFPARIIGLSAAGSRVHKEVEKFANDFDVMIIDCPPAVDSPVPQSALVVADLVLVPVIPSPPDLWAAVGIRDLIERTQSSINEDLRARLVPNMLQATNIAKEALDILAEFRIEVAGSKLALRTAYRQSAVYGTTAHRMDAKAALELDELAGEVRGLLELGARANSSNRSNGSNRRNGSDGKKRDGQGSAGAARKGVRGDGEERGGRVKAAPELGATEARAAAEDGAGALRRLQGHA